MTSLLLADSLLLLLLAMELTIIIILHAVVLSSQLCMLDLSTGADFWNGVLGLEHLDQTLRSPF